MKLILANSPSLPNSKVPWVYFGSSYLKMRECEKKLLGKRINLQDDIHNFAQTKKNYIQNGQKTKEKKTTIPYTGG